MLITSLVVCLLGYVTAEENKNDKNSHFVSQLGHLQEIPRRFEVKGENTMQLFKKYIHDIQDLASKNNLSVIYKVKVDLTKPKKNILKKIKYNKIHSKKYNVPLKKQSMKLSNFEVLVRKLAEETGSNNLKNEYLLPMTTEKYVSSSLRQVQKKFKPILGGVRTNFRTKIVRPVRNKIITLTNNH